MSIVSSKKAGVPPERLRELDALRGIAALSVVIYHYTARFPEMFPQASHIGFAFTWGHEAVLLFFAISGFVISFSLDRAPSVTDFAAKRFARLYPAYWGAMVLTLLVQHMSGVTALQVPPIAVAANVTMLQGFAYLPGVDGAYWTLGLELCFYVCMGALWVSGASRHLEPVILMWLGLGWLAWSWTGMPSRLMMLLVLQYIPFFAIGMLSYRVWAGVRTWTAQLPYMAAILISVFVQAPIEAAVLAVLLFVVFAAMVAGRLRFLAMPPLLWLGSISYALYLVHHNIGFVILLQADAMGFPPMIGFCLALASATQLAILLHYFVEQPAARWFTGWWLRRDQARLVAPSNAPR